MQQHTGEPAATPLPSAAAAMAKEGKTQRKKESRHEVWNERNTARETKQNTERNKEIYTTIKQENWLHFCLELLPEPALSWTACIVSTQLTGIWLLPIADAMDWMYH